MASGNKVFRAKATFFLNGIKVPVGALVREGHVVMKGVESKFEELKIDFEREDIQAQKDVKALAATAEVEVKAQAVADVKATAKVAEVDVAKAVESDAVKAGVEKAAS